MTRNNANVINRRMNTQCYMHKVEHSAARMNIQLPQHGQILQNIMWRKKACCKRRHRVWFHSHKVTNLGVYCLGSQRKSIKKGKGINVNSRLCLHVGKEQAVRLRSDTRSSNCICSVPFLKLNVVHGSQFYYSKNCGCSFSFVCNT